RQPEATIEASASAPQTSERCAPMRSPLLIECVPTSNPISRRQTAAQARCLAVLAPRAQRTWPRACPLASHGEISEGPSRYWSPRMTTGRLDDWMTNAAARRRTKAALVWSIVLTVALYLVPFGQLIGYPLVLLSTLVHEVGHGLAAVLVGGTFE